MFGGNARSKALTCDSQPSPGFRQLPAPHVVLLDHLADIHRDDLPVFDDDLPVHDGPFGRLRAAEDDCCEAIMQRAGIGDGVDTNPS